MRHHKVRLTRQSTWIQVFRPPLRAIEFVLSTIYADLFGWWLDRLRFRRLDAALASEIDNRLGFLLRQKNARMIQGGDYQANRIFGLAVVTVETDALHLRFVTVRSSLEVEVASSSTPYHWEDLSNALENAELSEGASVNDVVARRRSRSYSFYMDVDRLLRAHWDLLTRYCRRGS
jgi:hypothetical protein